MTDSPRLEVATERPSRTDLALLELLQRLDQAAGPEAMAAYASVAGVLSVVAGLYASLEWDTPSGPSIVVAALAFFVLSLFHLGRPRNAGGAHDRRP